MTTLHDRLDRLAGPATPVSDAQMAADLARGRGALRRRRAVKGAATGVFAVAAAVAVLTYGTATRPADQKAAPVASPPAATASPSEKTVTGAVLVAYQGKQPKGYTIDKIPAGWEIQGDLPSVLTMAPIGFKDKDPHSWIGKIAIMLQSQDDSSVPTGAAVTVGGKPGVITGPEDTTKSLYVKQPSGVYLQVQIYDATGWSNAEIAQFGAGVHVLPGAVQGRG